MRRSPSRLPLALIAASLFSVCDAATLTQRVNALILATPQVKVGTWSTHPVGACGGAALPITVMTGGQPSWRTNLDPVGAPYEDGRLADGREVIVVPLETCTTYHLDGALIYAQVAGKMRYVGHVYSPDAHAAISISGGRIVFTTPLYGTGTDFRGMCCPSYVRVQIFTIVGRHLRELSERREATPR